VPEDSDATTNSTAVPDSADGSDHPGDHAPKDRSNARAGEAAGGPTATPAGPAGSTGGSLSAVRGAVGFLTRLPAGTDAASWAAFRRTPAAFVPAGYLVGALVAVPFLLGLPAVTLAVVYPAALVVVTGINHADGVADLGDAAVVHGDAEERRAVMKDSTLGVGGTLALALVVAGLVTAAAGLVGLPVREAVAVVVAAEVSAKFGMAALACLGTAPAPGLGADLTAAATLRNLLVPLLLALPAAALGYPPLVAAAALAAGIGAALLLWRWAVRVLGGPTGDVFGAANELARIAALHAGVIAWTLS